MQILSARSGIFTRHLSISTGVIHISLFPGTKKIRRNFERKAVLRVKAVKSVSSTCLAEHSDWLRRSLRFRQTSFECPKGVCDVPCQDEDIVQELGRMDAMHPSLIGALSET